EVELEAALAPLVGRTLDQHLGLDLWLRVPVAVERLDDRAPPLDIELAHLVGATEVKVDGAGVDRGERPLGFDDPEQLPRRCLDHRHRVERRRAQRDLPCREAWAARQVAPTAAAAEPPGADQRVRALPPP